MTPLYCIAVDTDSPTENSINACLACSVPLAYLRYFTSPTPEKNAINCSDVIVGLISLTKIVLRISSISTGSVVLVIIGGVGRAGSCWDSSNGMPFGETKNAVCIPAYVFTDFNN